MDDTLEIQFLHAGLHTTIQDLGREGLQAKGIPIGGVLDTVSAKIANVLVGNPIETPVLEMTLLGAKMNFKSVAQIALTGANLSPKINGRAVKMYETLNIPKGASLSFGKQKQGARTYLAIRGEWQVQSYLGSCSPLLYMPSATPDSVIHEQSSLKIKRNSSMVHRRNRQSDIPNYETDLRLKVQPGPEFFQLPATIIAYFINQTFQVSKDYNRMGIRLETAIPNYQVPRELISSGIIPGTIQIDHEGNPIILLADAQTTGGYYRIANILSTDLHRLAQVKAGDRIGFVMTNSM